MVVMVDTITDMGDSALTAIYDATFDIEVL
jgi:hypothetical protein